MNLRVVNNNTPGWTLIVETAPNVTLDVGTELVVADPVKRAYALLWSVMTDDRRVHEARRLLLGTLTKEQQHAALAGAAEPADDDLRTKITSAIALAVVLERQGRYPGAGHVVAAVLDGKPLPAGDAQPASEPRNEWKEAIDTELVAAHIGTADSFPNARAALNALLVWQDDVSRYMATHDPPAAEVPADWLDRAERSSAESRDILRGADQPSGGQS